MNLHFLSKNIYTLSNIIFAYNKRLCNFCFSTFLSIQRNKNLLIFRSVFNSIIYTFVCFTFIHQRESPRTILRSPA